MREGAGHSLVVDDNDLVLSLLIVRDDNDLILHRNRSRSLLSSSLSRLFVSLLLGLPFSLGLLTLFRASIPCIIIGPGDLDLKGSGRLCHLDACNPFIPIVGLSLHGLLRFGCACRLEDTLGGRGWLVGHVHFRAVSL